MGARHSAPFFLRILSFLSYFFFCCFLIPPCLRWPSGSAACTAYETSQTHWQHHGIISFPSQTHNEPEHHYTKRGICVIAAVRFATRLATRLALHAPKLPPRRMHSWKTDAAWLMVWTEAECGTYHNHTVHVRHCTYHPYWIRAHASR